MLVYFLHYIKKGLKMKIYIFLLTLFMSLKAAALEVSCNVMFSPNGGIQQSVIESIDNAKKTIDMQAYSYTSEFIGNAIRRAKSRGIKVRILIDRTGPKQESGELPLDKEAGIEIYVDKTYRIAHNKIIIIDSILTLTGSYNWSVSAERYNSENLLNCKSRAMAKVYTERFNYLITKANPY